MKRLIPGILLLFIAFAGNAQSKIGTIDAEYIISQMPENEQVSKSMQTYNEELQADLKTNIAEYEKLVKDYQETSKDLEEELRRKKEDTIMGLENDIKGFRQKASVMMQMKRNELTGPLYEKIDKAMKEVIAEEGFTQIFSSAANGLAFSRAEDDITEKVMDKLGIEAKPQASTEQSSKN